MLYLHWDATLLTEIQSDLTHEQRQALDYFLSIRGKLGPFLKPVIALGFTSIDDFQRCLQSALSDCRAALAKRGINNSWDLDFPVQQRTLESHMRLRGNNKQPRKPKTADAT